MTEVGRTLFFGLLGLSSASACFKAAKGLSYSMNLRLGCWRNGVNFWAEEEIITLLEGDRVDYSVVLMWSLRAELTQKLLFVVVAGGLFIRIKSKLLVCTFM